MAGGAIGKIKDVLLRMLFLHLLRFVLVALIAGVIAQGIGMAGGAVALCPAVVEREAVAEADVPPAVGVMAIGALSGVVVFGLVVGVAALAVGLAGVIKGRTAPFLGGVAVRALPPERSVVGIVISMAVHAARRRAGIHPSSMALLAGGGYMLPG